MTLMIHFSILYEACLLIVQGLGTARPGTLLEICIVFENRLSAFHIHIVNSLYISSHNENSCLGMSQIAIITITTLTALMFNNNHSR